MPVFGGHGDRQAARDLRQGFGGEPHAAFGKTGQEQIVFAERPGFDQDVSNLSDQLLLEAEHLLELELEVEALGTDKGDELVQGGNRFAGKLVRKPSSRVQRADLVQRRHEHRTAAVGRPVERLVMDHHQRAVAGQADIGLDPARTHLLGHANGGQRVLGRVRGSAAMGDEGLANERLGRGHGGSLCWQEGRGRTEVRPPLDCSRG